VGPMGMSTSVCMGMSTSVCMAMSTSVCILRCAQKRARRPLVAWSLVQARRCTPRCLCAGGAVPCNRDFERVWAWQEHAHCTDPPAAAAAAAPPDGWPPRPTTAARLDRSGTQPARLPSKARPQVVHVREWQGGASSTITDSVWPHRQHVASQTACSLKDSMRHHRQRAASQTACGIANGVRHHGQRVA